MAGNQVARQGQPGMQNLTMEGVRLIFRNFAGEERPMNAAGQRNFGVVIPHEAAEQMIADGWPIKFLRPREAEDLPQPWLKVKVKLDGKRPPRVVMISSRGRTTLDEDTIGILDWADLANVDLIVRPYEWVVSGNTGISAYLQTIFVTIQEDELERKYSQIPDADDGPRQITSGYEDEIIIEDEEN